MESITFYGITLSGQIYFIAFICLAVLVFYTYTSFKKKKGKSFNSDASSLSSSLILTTPHTICDSINCIRCSRNHEILQLALTRLSYLSESDKYTKNDLKYLSKDIEKSLACIKEKEKGLPSKKHDSSQHSTPAVFQMFGLKDQELWSIKDFPALQILNQHLYDITCEFQHLYDHFLTDETVWKVNSTNKGRWEIAHLINQGHTTKVAEMCPVTYQILKKIPYFLDNNLFGDASYSVVHSGTDISTHCGSTNIRLRCHFGLIVPPNECYLKVGEKICHWKENQVLCFNDAYAHSVHHNGQKASGMRVVFMFDIWHPDVTESQKQILNYAFSS
ncbi:aspartate beta-hydroxylase domain-containing protein 2-like isoform X1 [Biomphalaria glabrata]|uniref:Aspartate beta-hydroxylase domain-containing protein 2-like isoform X1 n=1 Tax=Biomphalaria glabrata TaxID=6526 RepID=A0A9U8EGX5_BIOGL|nr:aspartate beta-hydroxylase domain-containing protein 2-like isoform X1 [Biomphalaria glabrata]KAI8782862.1 aspartate beta-hydroxylase domain-containing protein 2 [Biomphalaria glabrata]